VSHVGPARDTYVVEMTAWLSDEDLAQVNRLIERLQTRLLPSERGGGKRLCSLALSLTPLPREEAS